MAHDSKSFYIKQQATDITNNSGHWAIKSIVFRQQKMGSEPTLCSSDPGDHQFLSRLAYHSMVRDPTSNSQVPIYLYKQIFLQLSTHSFPSPQHCALYTDFLSLCARVPSGLQSVARLQPGMACGKGRTVGVFMEYLNYPLREHLDMHRFRGTGLKEGQLLYLLRELVGVCVRVVRSKMRQPQINSDTVYVNSTYEVKVPIAQVQPEGLLPSSQTEQSMKSQARRARPLLAPEQLPSRTPGSPSTLMFALGMLILECCTLLDPAVTYYNYSAGCIDLARLNQHIKQVKYGRVAGVLSRMLQRDPQKRIKLGELEAVLGAMPDLLFEGYLLID